MNQHGPNELCFFCADDDEMLRFLGGQVTPTLHFHAPRAFCPHESSDIVTTDTVDEPTVATFAEGEIAAPELAPRPADSPVTREAAAFRHGYQMGIKQAVSKVEEVMDEEDGGEACCGKDNYVDFSLRLRIALRGMDPASSDRALPGATEAAEQIAAAWDEGWRAAAFTGAYNVNNPYRQVGTA